MKKIIIKEEILPVLSENLEQEGGMYNSPDSIKTDDLNVNWGSKDAQPFFLLPNHKIVFGEPRRTHNDYIKGIIGGTNRRNFINSVILQGRYWEDENIFSFWNMSLDDMSSIKYVIKSLGDLHRDCFVFYKDKQYKVILDDGNIFLQAVQKGK